jgi:hypothetical protein
MKCRYFGRARELPGVKELLSRMKPEELRKVKHDELAGLDAEYYGYLDEDLGKYSIEWNSHVEDHVTPYPIHPLAIPTQEEVEAHLLKRKQEELLQKYALFQ